MKKKGNVEMANILSFFEDAKTKYSVSDLLTEHSYILFILESPHKEELKFDVPLAGSSGKSMAKVLFNKSDILPMGKHLKELIRSKKDSIYGIVNVSPFPLQKSAYPDSGFIQKYEKELNIAESVRISTAKTFKDKEKEHMHFMLLQDFQERLKRYVTPETVIVPCGRFAEKYLNQTPIIEKVDVIRGVPHPSYNSWSRQRYQDAIQRIRERSMN
jgi:hypothetical protein